MVFPEGPAIHLGDIGLYSAGASYFPIRDSREEELGLAARLVRRIRLDDSVSNPTLLQDQHTEKLRLRFEPTRVLESN